MISMTFPVVDCAMSSISSNSKIASAEAEKMKKQNN